ncbi:MAG: hypothetical protein JXD23_02480 [Spirochaetales bacterium]|nr:hypothetical protein [Spirochaetales bacterium]
MKKRPLLAAGIAIFLFVWTPSLFAQSLPVSGALDKTDWSLKKDDSLGLLLEAGRTSAEVAADGVSWTIKDFQRGLFLDGGRLTFNEAGALYRVSFVRMYNLEEGNTAETFRDFIAATADGYVKKLGKAGMDETKTVPGAESGFGYAALVWRADPGRAVAPELKIEIVFFAAGTFVYFTETCTNTAVAPDAPAGGK